MESARVDHADTGRPDTHRMVKAPGPNIHACIQRSNTPIGVESNRTNPHNNTAPPSTSAWLREAGFCSSGSEFKRAPMAMTPSTPMRKDSPPRSASTDNSITLTATLTNNHRRRVETLDGRVPATNRFLRNHTVASVALVRFMYVHENARSIMKITTDHAAATPYAPSRNATSYT